MPVTCPRCAYLRKPSDANPDWQCPSCGVAYAKAGASGTEPEAEMNTPHYRVEPAASPWPRRLFQFGLAIGVALAVRHFMPTLLAGGPLVEPVAAPSAVEVTADEIRAMVGEGGEAQAFLAQNPDNPALEMHYYKVESGDDGRLIARPLLTGAAQARLRELTPQRVVLFGTATCTYCAQVRRYLDHHRVAYADLDVQTNLHALDYETNVLQTTSYPVLVIDREVMFGYNAAELARAVKEL